MVKVLGRLVAWGRAALANSDSYEGDWKDGKEHGRGVYVWASGDRYDGDRPCLHPAVRATARLRQLNPRKPMDCVFLVLAHMPQGRKPLSWWADQ